MIEITIYNEQKKTRRTVRPFAWFHWPLELIQAISSAFKPVRVTGGFVSRSVLKSDGRFDVLKTSTLSPVSIVTLYEDNERFSKDARTW